MSGIYLLKDKRITEDGAAGPKAQNLGKLSSMHFRVPKGFCISSDIYTKHIERHHLTPLIESALKAEHEHLSEALGNVRTAIINSPVCNSVKREIEKQFDILNCDSAAIRSSATAEDLPGKSSAGQYETFLGIKDSDDCIEAIKKCWASLWSQRAFDYRSKNRIDHLRMGMAVIVQSLITSDVSGVIFTADPVTGRREGVVIEACFGLGEALVSGKVTPDRFIVDKKTNRLFFRSIAEKKIECVPDEKEGVKEKTIPNEKAIAHTLNIKQIKKLAKLAQKIEAVFGCPQDIEWAMKSKRIWILQSRPITNLPEPKVKSWEERQVWTNSNVGEAVPDVITPLTWSILEPLVDVIFRPVLNMLCVDTGDNPVFGMVAGRVYFNINTITGAFSRFPNAINFDTTFGGHQRNKLACERLSIPPEDVPDVGGNLAKVVLRLPLSLAEVLWNGKGRRARVIRILDENTTYLSSLDLHKMSAGEAIRKLGDCTKTIAKLDLTCLITAIAAIPTLERICKRWLDDQNGNIFNRLLSGNEGLEDAQTGFDLWRIAKTVNQDHELKELLISDYNWEQIQERLNNLTAGADFLLQWNEFMERNGHHCRGELDLANPRWREMPDYVLTLVRSYLNSGGDDPEQRRKKLIDQRQALICECCKSIGLFRRILFKHFAENAWNGCLFRENSKNRVVSFLASIRTLILRLGNRFAEDRILLQPDDIFFLKYEELGMTIDGDSDFDPKQTVSQRKTEYERNLTITPPPVVMGIFNPENYIGENLEADTERLTGISVSPGVITGPARVILRASDDYVRPGEILVAPFTDPGWTPYFVNAIGIVMDMGGLLSHGSIVAREYGIPCVVNVGPATKIIKTGQIIKVDGNMAQVQILKDTKN